MSSGHPHKPRWVSEEFTADYLGVTKRTVHNYIIRGVLPARRIRNGIGNLERIRIDMADVDALLEPYTPEAVR